MKFDENGIHSGAAGVVPWSEIVALHVTKVDTMSDSVTILQLEHESGHYLEIDESDDSFRSAFESFPSFLPLEEDWDSVVKGLEPRSVKTLWRR